MPRDNEARSTRFYAPGVIDEEAWFRVAARDYETLIRACDFPGALAPVRTLFDAGCGLGKFPALLAPALGGLGHDIAVDYLDPSLHCVETFAEALPAPFVPREGIHSRVEDFSPGPRAAYDLVWAIQSVYAWDRDRLDDSLAKLESLAGEEGGMLIFQAAASAFYHRFHNAYREAFGADAPAYIMAEEVWAALPPGRYARRVLRFDHTVPAADEPLLEAYLQQMCFDRSKRLADFLAADATGTLLRAHHIGRKYRFPQEVWLAGTAGVMARLGCRV